MLCHLLWMAREATGPAGPLGHRTIPFRGQDHLSAELRWQAFGDPGAGLPLSQREWSLVVVAPCLHEALGLMSFITQNEHGVSTCKPSTQEFKAVSATQQVQDQPGLHEASPQNKQLKVSCEVNRSLHTRLGCGNSGVLKAIDRPWDAGMTWVMSSAWWR